MNNKVKYGLFAFVAILVLGVSAIVAATTIGEEATIWAMGDCHIDGERVLADDVDTSDGEVLYLYGAWMLRDPDGIVIQDQAPEQIHEAPYTAQTTFTAEKVGMYVIEANVFYAKLVFNTQTNAWDMVDSGSCVTDQNLGGVEVTLPPVDMDSVLQIITSLYNSWRYPPQ